MWILHNLCLCQRSSCRFCFHYPKLGLFLPKKVLFSWTLDWYRPQNVAAALKQLSASKTPKIWHFFLNFQNFSKKFLIWPSGENSPLIIQRVRENTIVEFQRDRETSLLEYQASPILRHMAWENFHFEKMKILDTFVLESLQIGWICIRINVLQGVGGPQGPLSCQIQKLQLTKAFYKYTVKMSPFHFQWHLRS